MYIYVLNQLTTQQQLTLTILLKLFKFVLKIAVVFILLLKFVFKIAVVFILLIIQNINNKFKTTKSTDFLIL